MPLNKLCVSLRPAMLLFFSVSCCTCSFPPPPTPLQEYFIRWCERPWGYPFGMPVVTNLCWQGVSNSAPCSTKKHEPGNMPEAGYPLYTAVNCQPRSPCFYSRSQFDCLRLSWKRPLRILGYLRKPTVQSYPILGMNVENNEQTLLARSKSTLTLIRQPSCILITGIKMPLQ